jgi:hypothetical protein
MNQYGYMGLTQPYKTIDQTGRNLTYYPNGTIVNNETGQTNQPQQPIQTPNNNYYIQQNNTIVIIGIIAIVSITAMYLFTKK